MAWFFTKVALLTFGGAYAVLPCAFQGAVEQYECLSAPQMIDGLALAEPTPGPSIMVVSFVGFVGGWSKAIFRRVPWSWLGQSRHQWGRSSPSCRRSYSPITCSGLRPGWTLRMGNGACRRRCGRGTVPVRSKADLDFAVMRTAACAACGRSVGIAKVRVQSEAVISAHVRGRHGHKPPSA